MVILLFAGGVFGIPLFGRYLVKVHQEGVISELNSWGNEYSEIRSDKDAIRSIEMLDYISIYYVPSDGYRSFPSTEEKLAEVRRKNSRRIIDALTQYTKKDFDDRIGEWKNLAQKLQEQNTEETRSE